MRSWVELSGLHRGTGLAGLGKRVTKLGVAAKLWACHLGDGTFAGQAVRGSEIFFFANTRTDSGGSGPLAFQ